MAREVLRYDSTETMAAQVAQRFLALLENLQAQERTPQVVLTGGSFAQSLYEHVARRASDHHIDWANVDFWWGDERFVAPDSPDRNALEARQTLLDRVGATRIHEMPTPNSACSVDEGARAYEAEVRNSPADEFDLVLLSLGPDGHIASLFPGSPQLNADRIVVGVTGSPKPPPERITLTVDALNHAARMWLFAADSGPGGAKEQAFNEVLAGNLEVPAARVQGREETIWFVSST